MQMVKENQNYWVDSAGSASLIQEPFTEPYPSARFWGGRLRAQTVWAAVAWFPCTEGDGSVGGLPEWRHSLSFPGATGISTQGGPDPHGMRLEARGAGLSDLYSHPSVGYRGTRGCAQGRLSRTSHRPVQVQRALCKPDPALGEWASLCNISTLSTHTVPPQRSYGIVWETSAIWRRFLSFTSVFQERRRDMQR